MNAERKNIEEISFLEQNLQNIFFQKQAFQLELSETESSLDELSKSSGDVFKITGQIMIKAEKSKIEEELKNKKKILDLRIKSLEAQEDSFSKKIEQLREKLV